jgi:hypothetical protein
MSENQIVNLEAGNVIPAHQAFYNPQTRIQQSIKLLDLGIILRAAEWAYSTSHERLSSN